jgi:folate-binding protein YgfZ
MIASPFDAPLLFDLTGRGEIALTGKDRVPFLHGLVTNDVKKLRPGDGCAAAFLGPKGKLLAELVVLAAPDELVVDCPAELGAALEQLFRKYLVFGDVSIEDRTATTGVLHVEGSGAEEVLRNGTGLAPPVEPHSSVSTHGMRAVRESRGGFPGLDFRVPRTSADSVRSRLLGAGAVPSSLSVLESARIEAGIPRWGAELTEGVLPDEAGLPARGWVSYTKGCYIGQETVARIRTYGHVNRNLVGLVVDGASAPAPGAGIRAGEARVGAVTSATLSERLGKAVALGYVKRESAAPGTSLTVDTSGGPQPAVVTVLPVDR